MKAGELALPSRQVVPCSMVGRISPGRDGGPQRGQNIMFVFSSPDVQGMSAVLLGATLAAHFDPSITFIATSSADSVRKGIGDRVAKLPSSRREKTVETAKGVLFAVQAPSS
jgi:hypothetical protein